jgi:DNA-directed RNA polymerase sigma subunit (sigma70/sigma32)
MSQSRRNEFYALCAGRDLDGEIGEWFRADDREVQDNDQVTDPRQALADILTGLELRVWIKADLAHLEQSKPRNAQLIRAVLVDGRTLATVARRASISRERARQIVASYLHRARKRLGLPRPGR